MNKGKVFLAVAEEISMNQLGSGITCDGLTGQCKLEEEAAKPKKPPKEKPGDEKKPEEVEEKVDPIKSNLAKKNLRDVIIQNIRDMKKDNKFIVNIPEEMLQEPEPAETTDEAGESAEGEAGKESVTVDPPGAPPKGETGEEEEKPAKKKKKGKKGKKAGKKSPVSGGFE